MTLPLALSQNVINVAYLVAAALLILGIKQLSSPRTARLGNVVAAVGMAIALLFTLLDDDIDSYWLIAAGVAVGTVAGAVSARRVRMTAMPQMVALFNGVGGGAAALIAAAEFHRLTPEPGHVVEDAMGAILFSALIGSISFSGSLVAFAKLQELMPGRPVVFPAQQVFNGTLFLGLLAFGAVAGATEVGLWVAFLLAGALLFGILLVLPIGGADMPVVISLLNAFTGLAVASAGFVLDNTALIIGGTLVGASGTLLTILMGRAMNRSLGNVLFSAFGAAPAATSGAAAAAADSKTHREITAEDAAVMLSYARRVVIVPGYGLAVAQAQHNVRELADLLERRAAHFIALLQREGGKTLDDSVSEVREAVDFCRYYAAQGRELFGEAKAMPGPTGESNMLCLRGRGVFVAITVAYSTLAVLSAWLFKKGRWKTRVV